MIKNNKRKISIVFVVFVALLMLITSSENTDAVTMEEIPTVTQTIVETEANTRYVTNEAEFATAISTAAVSVIKIQNDISTTGIPTFSNTLIDRNLRIDGQGHSINSRVVTRLFQLNHVPASNRLIEFKNINFNHIDALSNGGVITLGSPKWDIVLENVTTSGGGYYLNFINSANVIGNVFFRGTNNIHTDSQITNGAINVIFEEGSNTTLQNHGPGIILLDSNVEGVGKTYPGHYYVASNSKVRLETAATTNTAKPMFDTAASINVYDGGELVMYNAGRTTSGVDFPGTGPDRVYNVDNGGKLSIINGNGPALSDNDYGMIINGNPGSSITLSGAGETAVNFTSTKSSINLNNPGFFDFVNTTASNRAINFADDANKPFLNITNAAGVSVWERSLNNNTGAPSDPSPIIDINLYTGNEGPLVGSSQSLVDANWNTSRYSRIKYADYPVIDDDDVIVEVGRTHNIGNTISPTGTIASYVVADNSVASINSSGVITGLKNGETTITATLTSPAGTVAEYTIKVFVNDGKPVINAPTFTELNMNVDFDPMIGVSATDFPNIDLTALVQVNSKVDTSVAGIYIVKYTVTDADLNKSTAQQVVLVNDGSYVVGQSYILFADDFERRVGQVDNSNDAVIEASTAKVYDKNTGLESTTTLPYMKASGGYEAVEGLYTIQIAVADDETINKNINANVTAGNSPEFVNADYTTINVGTSFNNKNGVTVSDDEDGDTLTSKYSVEGTVDINVPGVYKLNYTVTDSDFNTTNHLRVVTVIKSGEVVSGANYVIMAKPYTIRRGEVTSLTVSDASIISSAQVKVYEQATGDLVENPTLTIIKGSPEFKLGADVGIYPVTFKYNNESTLQITTFINVTAGKSPTINNADYIEITKGSTFDANAGVTYLDDEDKTISSDKAIISGEVDTEVAGVYKIVYSITDSDFNSTTKTRIVVVSEPGVVIAGSKYIVEAHSYEIRKSLVNDEATSNAKILETSGFKLYDKNTGDLVTNPNVLVSKGSPTYQTGAGLGNHPITFVPVLEPSLNIQIIVNVISGEAPVLKVTPFIEVPVGGVISPDEYGSATDKEDGFIQVSDWSIASNLNLNVPGVYHEIYTVTDSDGNTDTELRVIAVSEPGALVVGDTYIIQANDYTIRKSDVNATAVSDATIIKSANVKVYAKNTGTPVDGSAVTVKKGVPNYEVGVGVGNYPVDFSLTSEPGLIINNFVTVEAGEPPVINGATYLEINKGTPFNSKEGITVTDDFDTLTSDDVEVKGTVDINVSGVYKLEYSVTDSDGNKSIVNRVVVVKADNEVVVGTNYIIKAKSYSIRKALVTTEAVTDTTIKSSASVQVYNKKTGDLIGAPIVNVVKGTPAYSVGAVVGEYPITLTYSLDSAATINIKVNVHAGTPPVLNGVDYKVINVNDTFVPLDGITVTDADETIAASKVKYTGTYDTSVPGIYKLNYSVTDSDGNSVNKDRILVVTKPGEVVAGTNYIIKASSYKIRKGQVDDTRTSVDGIKTDSHLQVFDAKTGNEILNPEVTLTKNDPQYVVGVETGNYPINIKVNAEEAVAIDINAEVVSGESPVINGTDLIEITVGNSYDPLEVIEVVDLEDKVISNSEVEVISNVNKDVPGVYTITFNVTDSDGNLTTEKQVVVVSNGDDVIVGDQYILQANSYDIRKALVDATAVSDATIKTSANVKVYNKATGELIPDEAVNVEKGVPEYLAGVNADEYPINFSVASEPTLVSHITVNVFKGEAPKINGANFTQITDATAFDPLAGINVTDDYDTIANSSIVVNGSVENTMGVYPLTYSVTDSDGNKTTVNRVVVVGSTDNVKVGTNYIIMAQSYAIRVGQVNATTTGDTIVKQSAKVTVYDKNTGKLLANEPTTYTKATGSDEYKPGVTAGEYILNFSVNAETSTTISVKVKVEKGTNPTITGADYTEINLNDIFNNRAGVVGNDKEDGIITNKINVTGNVLTNISGVYKLKYTLTDSDQNTVSIDRVVVVRDVDDISIGTTYIIKANSYQVLLSEVTDEAVLDSTIKAESKITVYSKATGDVLKDQPVVMTRGVGDEEYKVGVPVGSYPITYTIDGGTVSHTINIEVISGEAPVFSGLDLTIINKGDVFDPNADVSVFDKENGDIPLKDPSYSVSGIVNTDKAGVYTLIYRISDRDGNETVESRVVVVNDPNEITIGDKYIIQAKSYEIRKGQVSAYAVTDDVIIDNAEVSVYDIKDGHIVEDAPISVTKKTPTYEVGAELGDYPIEYSTTLEDGLSITSKVTVISGNAPLIIGTQFIETTKGNTFDILSQGHIEDDEDGIIPNTRFIITGDTVDYNTVGIYKVNYSITDSDGNTVNAQRIIAVTEPGKLVVGDNYIIEANDYQIRKSLVDTTAVMDETIINSANVKVYDKLTGLENTTVTKTVTKNNPQYVAGVDAGEYKVDFSIEEENTLKIQNKITVIKGNAPVINGLTFAEVEKGGLFDQDAGVSVTDDFDTGLVAVVTSGSVDTSKAGVYKLVYSVTDSDGNKTTNTRVVAVSAPNELVVGTEYIMQAHNYTLRRGQVNSTAVGTQSIKNSSELKVYNKATGNLITSPVVDLTKDAGYVINAPVGDYQMSYIYAYEPSLRMKIYAKVVAGNAPTINGATSTSINKGTTFNPLAGITVTDDFDTLTSANVTVTGSVDKDTPGIYKLVYSVKDSDLNITTVTRVVVVSDPQVIVAGTDYAIVAKDYEIRKGQINTETISNESIISSAKVKVYRMDTGEEVLTPNIKIVKNAPMYDIGVNAGDYSITYSVVEDETASITKKVVVTDGESPVIDGIGIVEVLKGSTFDEMQGVSASDLEDGDGLVVEVTGTVDYDTIGVYHLTYTTTDSDRNTTTAQRVVVVSTDQDVSIGNKYILIAFGYDIRRGLITEDSISDDTIKASSMFKVYDAITGLEVENPNITVTKNNPTYDLGVVVGKYPVVLSVNEEPTTAVEIKVNVVGSERPRINGADFAEVVKNDDFDPMNGIEVTDDFDAGLTATISSGEVNTNVAGVYKLVYTVSDSDGNTTTVQRVVAVSSPNELVVGDSYIIAGNGYSIYRRQVDADAVLETTITRNTNIKLYKKATGAPVATPRLRMSKPGYVVDAVVGTYPIGYTTTFEPTLKLTVNIEVLGGDPPVFEGVEFKNVPFKTSFDPLSGVSVTDTEETSIPNSRVSVTGSVDVNKPGIYKLNYSVTDADGNTTTKPRVVVVSKPGEVVVGDTYIIKAQGYTIRTGQVTNATTTDAAIIDSAKVVVYDKQGEVVTNPELVITKGLDPLEYKPGVNAGKYPLQFSINADPALKIDVVVDVISGESPVISGVGLKTLAVNSEFDKYDGVSVTDDFDTLNVTDIEVTGNINTAVSGVYPLVYTITDSDRNTTTVTRVIVVTNDNEIVVGDSYIIKANGYTIRTGQVNVASTSDSAIINSSNVEVYDKISGTKIVSPGITVTKIAPKYAVGVGVGTYKVNFSVSSDAKANVTQNINVVAGNKPVINGAVFTEVNVKDSFDPLKDITVTDDFDTLKNTDVSVSGTVNTNVVGVYPLTYSVTDSDGNKTTVKRVVVVTSPGLIVVGNTHIIQAEDYSIRKSKVNNEALVDVNIANSAKVKIFSKETGLPVESLQGSVTKGSPRYAVGVDAGEYPLTYTYAYDSSATITKKVIVFKGEAPTINGATFKEVTSGTNFDPRNGITVNDDYDSISSNDVKITGTVNTSKPGVYTLVYSITDSDGNSSSVTRVVVVTNSNSVVVGNDYIIEATSYSKYRGQVNDSATSEAGIKTDSKVKVYSKLTGQVVSENVNITKLSPSYVSGVDAGTYPIRLTVASDSKATILINVFVSSGDTPKYNELPLIVIDLNSLYDPKEGVIVTDTEDGTISNDLLSITNPVDTTKPGVYTVNYQVKDTDRNVSNASRVVVVDDGETISVGDLYIIESYDYTLRKGQLTADKIYDGQIIIDAKVRMYNALTGLEVTPKVNVVRLDPALDTTSDLGEYQIKFVASNEADLSTISKITVVPGNVPELSGVDFTQVMINSSFDALAGVSALDDEDKDITNKIRITSGSVDTSTAGVYNLEYSITDSDLNTVVENRVVVVKDDSLNVGENYIIQANNYEIRKGQVNDETVAADQVISSAKVKVYSKTTGKQLTGESVTYIPSTSSDEYKVGVEIGEYTLNFSVDSEPELMTSSKVKVVTGNMPVFNGLEPTYIKEGEAFDPMLNVVVSDVEDSIIKIDESNVSGSVDNKNSGSYVLTYTVTDSDGNVSTQTRVIFVIESNQVIDMNDDYALIASGYQIRKGQVSTNEVVDSKIVERTNVKLYSSKTGEENTISSFGITKGDPAYVVGADIGKYPIKITTSLDAKKSLDLSVSVNIEVIPGQRPVISTPYFNTVMVGEKFDVLSGIKVADAEDDNISTSSVTYQIIKNDQVVDNVDQSNPGIYYVNYTIIDSDGNSNTAQRIIVVYEEGKLAENESFVIFAEGYTIGIDELNSVTVSKKSILENSNAIIYNKVTKHIEDVSNIKLSVVNKPLTTSSQVGPYIYNLITDLDKTISQKIVISVVDGKTDTSTNAYMLANDFTISVSQFNKMTREDYIKYADAFCWDANTGEILNLNVDYSKIKGVGGIYDLVFTNIYGKQYTVKVTVTNELPATGYDLDLEIFATIIVLLTSSVVLSRKVN